MSTKLPDIQLSRNAGWSMITELYADTKHAIPFSMTGYTAKAQIRAEEKQASTLLADITAEIGTVDPTTEQFALDPAGNAIRLSLTVAQTSAIAATVGYADLLLAAAGAEPLRAVYWRVVIGDGETTWT